MFGELYVRVIRLTYFFHQFDTFYLFTSRKKGSSKSSNPLPPGSALRHEAIKMVHQQVIVTIWLTKKVLKRITYVIRFN